MKTINTYIYIHIFDTFDNVELFLPFDLFCGLTFTQVHMNFGNLLDKICIAKNKLTVKSELN